MFRDKASSAPLIHFIQAKSVLGDPSCEMSDASQVMLPGLCSIALVLKVRTKLGNVRLQYAVFQPCPALSRNDYFTFHLDLLGHQKRPHQKTTTIMYSLNYLERESCFAHSQIRSVDSRHCT